MPDLPNGLLSAVLQLALALIASGIMVKLLTLRQDRRKIAGEASSQEANAASVLTGASLQMVESAQRDALEARRDSRESKEENTRLWVELNKLRWKVYHLSMREAVLESALRKASILVPARPEYADETHEWPPPDPNHEEIINTGPRQVHRDGPYPQKPGDTGGAPVDN